MKADDPVDENNGDKKSYRSKDLRYDLLRYCQSLKINLVLGGSTKTLETLANCLKHGIPCWLIENTGGLTDFLIPMIRKIQECDEKDAQKEVDNLMEIVDQQSACKSIKKFDKDLLRTCLESFREVAICNASDFESLKSKKNLLKVFIRKQRGKRVYRKKRVY